MKNKMKYFLLTLIFILSLNHTGDARGNNGEEGNAKTLSPYFFIDNGDPSVDKLPLKANSAEVIINGVIADIKITQTYVNSGSRPINARYVFPASTRAAVHGMKMKIRDRVITAKIKEKKEARKIFEDAKREGKSASLLEQHRPNVFSMNVANVMPGDTISIELLYTELLVPVDGIYEFHYPTVVGPRYSNQEDTPGAEDKWIKSPYLHEGEKSKTKFNIITTLSTGMKLQKVECTSHKVNVDWKSDSIATVSLDRSESNGGNRDYIIRYQLKDNKIQTGMMLYNGKNEKFFLMMIQPPESVKTEDIPPREYIFVVDISGSMNGFPLDISKDLLSDLISCLRPTDRFNVILFSGGSQLMADSSIPATKKNIEKAIEVIDNQHGSGGTELYPAMQQALELPYLSKSSRSILIVTDGYISAEREVFRLIQKNLGRANVFAFGIGSSVNRYLIEGIARAGHGEPFIVTDPDKAPGAAQSLRKYIQSPVLTNVKVRFSGFEAYSVEPSGIPDLLSERPVILYGKYRGKAEGTVEITGISGTEEYSRSIDLSQVEPAPLNKTLSYLWARKRIQQLSDYSFNDENISDVEEIKRLGLTYNLLTRYTSFVAVYNVVLNKGGRAANVKQPLPLPQGVSDLAVGNTMGAAPEPEMYILLSIALLIFFSLRIAESRKGKNEKTSGEE